RQHQREARRRQPAQRRRALAAKHREVVEDERVAVASRVEQNRGGDQQRGREPKRRAGNLAQCAPFGALCSSSPSSFFHHFAWPVVPCPAVSPLAGIRRKRPRFTRLISRSSTPSSGGFLSSSAALIASSVASMRSRPPEGL